MIQNISLVNKVTNTFSKNACLLKYLIQHSENSLICWRLKLYQIFKKEGLTGSQILEGVAGEKWVTFFSVLKSLRNKVKSEIFNDKKIL